MGTVTEARIALTLCTALSLGAPSAHAGSPVESGTLEYAPGKGLKIVSADGQFAIALKVRAQILQTTELPDGGDPTLGLEIRRARLSVSGHLLGPKFKYKLELAFAPRDVGITGSTAPILSNRDTVPTRVPLLDWYVDITHVRDLNLRAGQYKLSFSRQRVASSGSLHLVDRSDVNSEFNLDRDIGLELHSDDFLGLGHLRYALGVSIGEGHSAFRFDDSGVLFLTRVEFHPLGFFDDAFISDLARTESPRFAVSGAYAFLKDGKGDRGILGRAPADGGTTDFHHATADILAKWQGAALLIEGHFRGGDRNSPSLDPTRDGMGWFAQAGYLLPSVDVEFVGRYGQIRPIGDDSALGESHELVAGVNWFLDGHRLKLQADFTHVWSDGFGDGDDSVRVQLEAGL